MPKFYPPNPCCDTQLQVALAAIPSAECCVALRTTVPAALIRACCKCACEFGSPLPPQLGLGIRLPRVGSSSSRGFG